MRTREILSLLEPLPPEFTEATTDTAIALSVAISLKRIADTLPMYSMTERQREMMNQLSRAQ